MAKEDIIVAEVTRSWGGERAGAPRPQPFISVLFETVIQTNSKRGYRLKSWKFSTVTYPGEYSVPAITETIVAVFVRRGSLAEAVSNDE